MKYLNKKFYMIIFRKRFLFIINNYFFDNGRKKELNILIKNNYLLDRYNDFFDIYNIENMEIINTDYINIEDKDFHLNDSKLKKEMDIDLFCD